MPTALAPTYTPNPLGGTIPAHSVHGISVSLPKWKDNINYEEHEPETMRKIRSAYPRFKIHHLIESLQSHCARKFGNANENCHLYPSARSAELCREYMHAHSPDPAHPVDIRIVRYTIHPPEVLNTALAKVSSTPRVSVELHIVFFPKENAALAFSFWQHTGSGISSRLAEYCLALLSSSEASAAAKSTNGAAPASPTAAAPKAKHRHYGAFQKGTQALSTPSATPIGDDDDVDGASPDWSRFVEERYARNLPLSEAPMAKRQLRRRIAGVLLAEKSSIGSPSPAPLPSGPSEDDVYLLPAGMCAIWHAHRTILGAFPPYKSICFGFPYTDTLKILQKWGPGCHFFGHGLSSDLPALEETLKAERDAGTPIRALFCEVPSNPLLRTPPLVQLRRLADEYGFVVVVDETIGSFANVEVMPLADIVVSSLSKVFSGETNVLGGSLVLNPAGQHYEALKKSINEIYEDNYWLEDAVFMERNSRDFAPRVKQMNHTTEVLCEFLHSRSTAAGPKTGEEASYVIKDVFYPKWVTRENYDECRIGSPEQIARSASRSGGTTTTTVDVASQTSVAEGGYGMLFSLTFTSEVASSAFFDTLQVEKGPSLGTNFTLASPYTILAHYTELDWAAQYGVERNLVRVSVGLEDEAELLNAFKAAVKAGEDAVKEARASGTL